ncbi:hypothetical protein FXN63_11080 [Pigmentiphaga aceris]|uniref:Uncharacterized protein n=1 Tax=Pigmentiphaga aceris TaxID=1940612 RepID=A0A5C0AY06_9BURK|nr:hypothetical protein [Pigmentiphaga aceris]QEI06313.1 hypothetical protein FXN63_11080 [Pigmentiphaga aceris]
MERLGEGAVNTFMAFLKTPEDFKRYFDAGGIGSVEARIERLFGTRLKALQRKVTILLECPADDGFTSDLLVDSILVDCRALFLEHPNQKKNATLQTVYRTRRMDEAAASVDSLFDTVVSDDQSVRQVLKAWVDKRIVHIDWLWEDEEEKMLANVKALLFGDGTVGLLEVLDRIVEEYEYVKLTFGENYRAQIDRAFELFTGDPDDSPSDMSR